MSVRRTVAVLVVAAAGITAALRADAAPDGTPVGPRAAIAAPAQPFWSEEFAGPAGSRPARAAWHAEIGNRRQQGWWNNELQYYTDRRSNAALTGSGRLRIQARRTARSERLPCWPRGRCAYTSARLTTEGRVSLATGRVEVRAKLPVGRGLLPAIWMLGNNGRVWPRQGEIDIVEVVGGEPRTVYGTAHGPHFFNEDGLGGTMRLPQRADEAFHVYSVIKEPNRITWLVDGTRYFTLTPADVPSTEDWVFEQDLHLLLNVAVGGDWPGDPRRSTRFPATMTVDYVRMYGSGVVDGRSVSSPAP